MKRVCTLGILTLAHLAILAAGDPIPLAAQPAAQPDAPAIPPLSPREELATFRVAKGFTVDLVAAEPEVIDPVAITFDHEGWLYVIEMRGYPNGGLGDGEPVLPGRIKRLEDRDGDGYFETSTVFVDGLRFPTGVTPWRDGIIVADAPNLLYCPDRDGDGQADEKRLLYTGFGTKNIQQLANSLQYHFDNWIHGCNGLNEGTIRSVEKPDAPPVVLRGRHFRFNPDVPGSLEPTSGGGQYGLACDDWGNWFTCTNNQHVRHVVLPDHYLRRNPYLAVATVSHDIPDGVNEHYAAAKVFRISPFEPWRLDRTSRRVANPEGKSFPATELVPGGYVTSGTGILIYRGGAFPHEYDGDSFVCDPANNLIHRDKLVPDGITFKAVRADEGCEFLGSTDVWFRPVFLCHGPDGAIYVADFYREVIETPLSLPEDIQKRYNLQSRERGRIWRIRAVNQATTFKLPRKGAPLGLAQSLGNANAWVRLTAQRLLREHGDPLDDAALNELQRQAATGKTPQARLHALWTLQGKGKLSEPLVRQALADKDEKVVEQAIILAEPFLIRSEALLRQVEQFTEHASKRLRCQAAYALGQVPFEYRIAVRLFVLLKEHRDDPWMRDAVLSSSRLYAKTMILVQARERTYPPDLAARIARMVGRDGLDDEENRKALGQVLDAVVRPGVPIDLFELSVVEAVAPRLAQLGMPLEKLVKEKPRLADVLARAGELARNDQTPLATRQTAARLVAEGPFDAVATLAGDLLKPDVPTPLQVAAVQALGRHRRPEVATLLIDRWPTASPAIRRELQEALFARTERLPALLDAVEQGRLAINQIDLSRREQLAKHPDANVRERAARLMAAMGTPSRKEVVETYRSALVQPGDAARGKLTFKKNCAACHRLENEGRQVGADLLSALKTKTRETLLYDVLDPNREVDARYVNYLVLTKDGQTRSGIIASETASSLTLQRAEQASDTILRADVEQIRSTAKSLMPEELEKQMTPAEVADLLEYLLAVGRR